MPLPRCFAPPKAVPLTTAPVPLLALAVLALAEGRYATMLTAAIRVMGRNRLISVITTATEGRVLTTIVAVSFAFFPIERRRVSG